MSRVIDHFTGLVNDYDPTADVDEYIVCSLPRAPGRAQLGHATYQDLRLAKLCQLRLHLKGIEAWIEHIKPFGPPSIEEQLDAEIYCDRHPDRVA